MARIRESAEVYKSRKVQTNPTHSEISIQLIPRSELTPRGVTKGFRSISSPVSFISLPRRERGKSKGPGGDFGKRRPTQE